MGKHTQTIRRQIATPKISLKEKFDTLKIKFIDDFESMRELFFFRKLIYSKWKCFSQMLMFQNHWFITKAN